MMQSRDWVIGFIGIIVGAIGFLSLIKYLPFELSRTALIWIATVAGFILLYSSVIEITNSNILGTISLIVAGFVLIISILPLFNSFGWLGDWAGFGWIGEILYKIVLIIEGVFMAIATFAMEL